MVGPLLGTKLHVPRLRRALIARPRLSEALSRGAESGVTLVSAPAGFGKTTLLAEWLANASGDGRSVAWLALDQRDNDPTLFWTYLVAALDTAAPGVGAVALSLLQPPRPPIDTVLTTLLNDLDALPCDVVLVLDDYHVIDARDVQDGMTFLLFPVVKRQSEAAALGFVATRVLEAATILVGVVCLLAVVTLRQDLAGATGSDAASLATTGHALVAIRDWTFLFGPGVMAGMNALLLGSLMYRSGLVPRVIPLLGLIGAPLLLASTIGTLFGFFDQLSPVATVLVLPIFVWELSLGVWLVVKGFKPSPITAGLAEPCR